MTNASQNRNETRHHAVRQRPVYLLLGFLLGALVILGGGILLPIDSRIATILFDHRSRALPPWPVTVTCIEWIVAGVGVGDLTNHWHRSRAEARQLTLQLLPEDADAMFDSRQIVGLTRTIKAAGGDSHYLQRVLLRTIWQFQSTHSIAQASQIMNMTLELAQHELDLRYSLIRYIVWALPSIGFIGTVWGLSRGLAGVSGLTLGDSGKFQTALHATIGDLSLAFNTTMIALILSSLLVLAMHLIQESEESTLNKVGQYCIDHLINKLYVAPK
jgi:biopolymer transport protein ExbB/TolQ